MLLVVVLYVIIGILYRRLTLGHRGLDQFPSIPFLSISKSQELASNLLDWLRDLRDHFRGGAADLWPRSSASSSSYRSRSQWGSGRNRGFAPLAREEEEAMMYQDNGGPDGPDPRFSLEEDDMNGAQELEDAAPVPPPKNGHGDDREGVIRL